MTEHPHDLEALVAGDLPGEAARRTHDHLDACASCRREHDWLVAERKLVGARRRDDRAGLDSLWAAVEREIGGAVPVRRWRRRLALGAGVGAALAAAAVLVAWPRTGLVEREPGPGPIVASRGPDAGALPAVDDTPRTGRLAEAEEAVAEAERSYDGAIDLLEEDYRARRPGLPGPVAASHDLTFRESRRELREARASAGEDLDARVLVIDLYAHRVRSLRDVVRDLR